jgi:CO dehydrogenase maturation factor
MIISICGKGGTGKTTVSGLILDELARAGYPGPVLAIDGDPASTLSMTLGLPDPPATLADVREKVTLDAQTIRRLPAGTSPASYVFEQMRVRGVLVSHQLRQMPLDLVVMGQGEGPGCYCSLNRALSIILNEMAHCYPLVLLDNEAGLEHVSRYRLKRADLFLVVTMPNRAALSVAQRITATAKQLKIEIGESWRVFNQAPAGFQPAPNGPTLIVPYTQRLTELQSQGKSLLALRADHPLRQAVYSLIEQVLACA